LNLENLIDIGFPQRIRFRDRAINE